MMILFIRLILCVQSKLHSKQLLNIIPDARLVWAFAVRAELYLERSRRLYTFIHNEILRTGVVPAWYSAVCLLRVYSTVHPTSIRRVSCVCRGASLMFQFHYELVLLLSHRQPVHYYCCYPFNKWYFLDTIYHTFYDIYLFYLHSFY